jgi:hypothetical protein
MFKLYTLRLDSSVYWLVVSTPLKNISQWEGLSHIDIYIYIMGKIQTTNQTLKES